MAKKRTYVYSWRDRSYNVIQEETHIARDHAAEYLRYMRSRTDANLSRLVDGNSDGSTSVEYVLLLPNGAQEILRSLPPSEAHCARPQRTH